MGILYHRVGWVCEELTGSFGMDCREGSASRFALPVFTRTSFGDVCETLFLFDMEV